MDVDPSRGLLRYLMDVPDPRADNVSHSLYNMLVITLLAVLCRCEDYEEIALWAQSNEPWLATFLDLPHGTPHADTFERVFRRLDPAALERCFIAFTQAIAHASEGRLITIDGKTLRRSFDHGGRKAAIHMVNAWDRRNRLVLGQLATDDKSNEITAVPALLDLLDVRGAVVSLDAMHCQKHTALKIIERKADYLLQVKGNQKTLHEDLRLFFDEAIEHQWDELIELDQPDVDAGHGRIETRRLWASADVSWLRRQGHDWPKLRGIVRVECRREDLATGKTTTTQRCFITSLDPRKVPAPQLLAYVRGHWAVENQLHWCLDVCFREDACRVRKGHGPENLARIRRLAKNLLRANPPEKGRYASPSDPVSLKRRRLLCSLEPNYLLQTLTRTKNQMR